MAKLFKKECPMWKDFQLNVEQFRNVPLDVASANVECKSSEEDFEPIVSAPYWTFFQLEMGVGDRQRKFVALSLSFSCKWRSERNRERGR